MSAPTTPADLLDLKMMPAWVNEPAQANDYSQYEGEEAQPFGRERRGPQRGREQRDQRPRGPRPGGGGPRDDRRPPRRDERRGPDQRRPGASRPDRPPERREPREAPMPRPQVAVRFLPQPAAFESVIAQIKSGAVAYSVFALARLFLDKPERYTVRLTAAEGAVLHQLGENGPVAVDPRIVENGAFGAMRDEFYNVEQTQTEPIKGNFTNVARDRISGTLLGPTNHHAYQPQLRSLYEQRYSRRMSFQDFQRQIEVVSVPAVVEQWKEQARSITTYTAKNTEPPLTFTSIAEAERHFRQTHLPTLLRSAQELTISGVVSRGLPDRALGRLIEDEWSTEIRSPSRMMQELASGLRQAGLNIFRHRRGMLFVGPIRTRTFGHERAGVSASINTILEKLTAAGGINRKQLAEQFVPPDAEAAEQERVKRTLASDLRWLISEGYVIEFNDGTLDLPRVKAPAPAAAQSGRSATKNNEATTPAQVENQSVSTGTPNESARDRPSETTAVATTAPAGEQPTSADEQHANPATPFDAEAMPPGDDAIESGEEMGMSVEQSTEPLEQAVDATEEQVSATPEPGRPFASAAEGEAPLAESPPGETPDTREEQTSDRQAEPDTSPPVPSPS